VPKRTNLFQRVIATVYEHQSESPVAESKLMFDPKAGTDREVDVIVTETVAGEKITVGVEATALSKPLALPAVQALIAKHKSIGTSHVVIVSKSGFTGPALREIISAPRFSGYQPKDLSDRKTFEAKIVGQLATLWRSRFSVTLTDVFAEIVLPKNLRETNVVPWVHPPPHFPLLDSTGTEVATPESLFVDWAQRSGEEVAKLVGVTESTDDRRQTLQHDLRPPWRLDGRNPGALYVNVNTNIAGDLPTPEPLKLLKLDLRGPATIEVSRFDLQHRQLNENLAYSVGETEINGTPMLIVVSAGPEGEKITTLQLGTTSNAAKKRRNAASTRRKPRKRR
jgi:hypothetical protein